MHAFWQAEGHKYCSAAIRARATFRNGQCWRVLLLRGIDIFREKKLDGLGRWTVDRYAFAGKFRRDLDLWPFDLKI